MQNKVERRPPKPITRILIRGITCFEEKDLLKEYGGEYKKHMEQVKWG